MNTLFQQVFKLLRKKPEYYKHVINICILYHAVEKLQQTLCKAVRG